MDNRELARLIVDSEPPNGNPRSKRIENVRRQVLKWRGGETRTTPVLYLSERNAARVAPHLNLSVDDLVWHPLSEEERRLLELERLEARRLELRRELGLEPRPDEPEPQPQGGS